MIPGPAGASQRRRYQSGHSNFKNDVAAGAERGKGYSGIHHIGFQVESLDEIDERLQAAGSARRDDVNEALRLGQGHQRHGNVEVKYSGRDGIMIDVFGGGLDRGSVGYRNQLQGGALV